MKKEQTNRLMKCA